MASKASSTRQRGTSIASRVEQRGKRARVLMPWHLNAGPKLTTSPLNHGHDLTLVHDDIVGLDPHPLQAERLELQVVVPGDL